MTIRVLIADDHPIFVSGLRATFDDADDIEIVGTVVDGAEAVTSATELVPDVLLMDVRMPGMNGIDATRAIVASGSPVAVVVLTMFEDDETVFAAMSAGARGYLVKGATQERIVMVIKITAAVLMIAGVLVYRGVFASYFTGE